MGQSGYVHLDQLRMHTPCLEDQIPEGATAYAIVGGHTIRHITEGTNYRLAVQFYK